MPEAKICPHCGTVLQTPEVPRSLTAGRFLAADLLLWFTAALFFAYLWSPRADGEVYAVLAALALVLWTLMRSRQRADRMRFAERGRYLCEPCGLRFEGDELRELPPQ